MDYSKFLSKRMQPGSESEKAITFCKENNIEVVYNACFVVAGLRANFNN